MKAFLKSLARRSKTAIISFKVFDNWRLKRRIRSGNFETIHGSTQLNVDVKKSVAYIEKQFAEYCYYAGLMDKGVAGARILELGPGDNLGVALRFIAAGADSVVSLDRFYSKRDKQHEENIYRELLLDGPQFTEKIKYVYGAPLEEFVDEFLSSNKKFDLIVSCAVIEEIFDPSSTFDAMNALLAPGGVLVHKIDLTDYGMFRLQGMHALTFLTIPEWLYKRMASDSGLPNRKRLGYYASEMKRLGFESRLFVTSRISTGPVEPPVEYVPATPTAAENLLLDDVRGKLAREFKEASSDDLLIDGIWLIARKSSAN
jgi:hypothetical protein